jgi:spore coat polysaccharide biosynthesis protein SpsF
MSIVAIIQARMGSTRLPGKALRDICGRTMLARVVRRTRRSRLVDEVIIATTIEPSDKAIVDECKLLGVPFFRGSEQDVLDRYYRAARTFSADSIVRVTSDCPLIDAEIIDKVVRAFLNDSPDYASNTLVSTYPRGLDVEIFSMYALEKAHARASRDYQRVHVTPYIYQNPELFRLLSVTGDEDYSRYRWTVDTNEDLDLVLAIYDRLGRDDCFSWKDVLRLLEKEPDLAEINRHISQKSLEEC